MSKAEVNFDNFFPIVRDLPRLTVRRNGCWLCGKTTYYTLRFISKDKRMRTHRIAYQFFRGAIPEGLVLDHLCRNKNCWNPWRTRNDRQN